MITFCSLQVLRKKPDFRHKPWPTISESGRDFVKKLLVKDPRARLTAAQALCRFFSYGSILLCIRDLISV